MSQPVLWRQRQVEDDRRYLRTIAFSLPGTWNGVRKQGTFLLHIRDAVSLLHMEKRIISGSWREKGRQLMAARAGRRRLFCWAKA